MAMSAPRGGMMPDMPSQPKIGQATDSGLSEILEKYGFKVGQDFVLDNVQNVPGPVEYAGRHMIASLPMYVGVKTEEPDDHSFSVLAGINALVFPYSSSVDLVGPLAGGKVPSGGKLWTLAKSSPNAWKQTGFFFFSPTTKVTPKDTDPRGSYGLAYAYQGPLKSAYPPPAPAAAGMSTPDQPNAATGESRKPVRLVVVGDSDFASDEYLQFSRVFPIYEGGARMLLNSIGWTLEDEALTPVRTKTVAARPIQIDSDKKVAVIRYGNTVGVPLLFIGFGIVRWRLRRARRLAQKI
jgi:ABC-type uncharacterized transport system involved in gliding motility auxiliary subunit